MTIINKNGIYKGGTDFDKNLVCFLKKYKGKIRNWRIMNFHLWKVSYIFETTQKENVFGQ